MLAFSLLLPTRERPALVARLCASLLATTSDPEAIEVVLYVDEDDRSSADISHPSLRLIKLVGPRISMGAMTQACYRASSGRHVVLINDDAIIRTKNWDRLVARAMARFPDGLAMAYPNDLYYGKKVSTFPILTRAACDLMGEIVPAEYERHCIDSHVFDVFERLKAKGFPRALYLRDVVFEHMNYALGMGAFGGAAQQDHGEDQARYLALAPNRERIARHMADRIHSIQHERAGKILPRALVFVSVEDEGSRAAAARCLEELAQDDPASRVAEVVLLDSSAQASARLRDAAAKTAADYLVFLDGRCRLRPGWLEALFKAAEDERVGMVGSRWLNPRNGKTEQAGLGFFLDGGVTAMTRLYRGLSADAPSVNRERPLQAVERVGTLVKKAAFLEAGGLAGLGHAELCLEIRRRGLKVVLAPEATLYYAEPARTQESGPVISPFEPDLARLLAEDGFFIQPLGNGRWKAAAATVNLV